MEVVVLKDDPIKERMLEGAVYRVSRFHIVRDTDSKPLTRHGYRIILSGCSKIFESEDESIPRHGWSFFRMENITNVGPNFRYLVGNICLFSSLML